MHLENEPQILIDSPIFSWPDAANNFADETGEMVRHELYVPSS